jgi:hypothetical protein
MSLDPSAVLDLLTDKAEEIAPEIASRGFDKVLDAGSDLIGELEDDTAKEGGKAVLGILESNKDPFMRLTAEGFSLIAANFAAGKDETAMNIYIATQATYAERRAWMQQGGDLAQKEREERAAAWDAVKEVLKQVVKTGLPFLLKLAAKAVGLPLP